MKHLLLLSFLFLGSSVTFAQKTRLNALDMKVSLKVHPQEILESVIFRLKEETANIEYSSIMLAPFKAKVTNYKNTTMRQILNEQLEGTGIEYKLKGNTVILIYSATARNKR